MFRGCLREALGSSRGALGGVLGCPTLISSWEALGPEPKWTQPGRTVICHWNFGTLFGGAPGPSGNDFFVNYFLSSKISLLLTDDFSDFGDPPDPILGPFSSGFRDEKQKQPNKTRGRIWDDI